MLLNNYDVFLVLYNTLGFQMLLGLLRYIKDFSLLDHDWNL